MSSPNPQTRALFSQLPEASWQGLLAVDRTWQRVRSGQMPSKTVVQTDSMLLEKEPRYDVLIAGGTLGVFIGATLARRGWRVLLLERGRFEGRVQEWNISSPDLEQLVRLHLLTSAELAEITTSSFNPLRVAFGSHYSLWVRDVLNLGVSPRQLLALLGEKFLAWGGHIREYQGFEQVYIHPNGVRVQTQDQEYTGRLFLDAMGHFSPVVAQARRGTKPDGVCLVVGTCAQGFVQQEQADLLVSFTPTRNQCQYFWEAFPAADGRTTYLFTYLDAHPSRPSLVELFEEYCTLLPEYQGVPLDQLRFLRALYGLFPSYRTALVYGWDRVLPVGDAAGMQSPLSFGGFGALLRHLPRWELALDLALHSDRLDRASLAKLQPYQPNLAVTWLFQRAMSVAPQGIPPERINLLLSTVFAQMEALGPQVLMPFLRDVVQFRGLTQTLLRTAVADPQLIAQTVAQLGVAQVVGWLGHYLALGTYTGLVRLSDPLYEPMHKFLAHPFPHWHFDWTVQRQNWLWGAGLEEESRHQ
ncbi:geranylgeranyl reductase family protein [Anthocerotibacter panamensis]|uniref:FAD-binding oxidoreductase n=1 Tax=Anthocerotibacter panamensis TaxID=2857077 RepID=UPI001C4047D1|nr:FAD-binding oxidoreductase [Anthocerotibacter panamensis]